MERRRYARVPLEAEVKYRLSGHEKESSVKAYCSNVSLEGLCLFFEKPLMLTEGLQLNIALKTADNTQYNIVGEVIWAKDYTDRAGDNIIKTKAGIRIANMGEKEQKRFMLLLCDHMLKNLKSKFPQED